MHANIVRLSVFIGTAASVFVFQQTIPIRQVNVEATSVETMGPTVWVTELSDGRVLLNDKYPFRAKLILFDATLANATQVADSNLLTMGPFRGLGFGVVPFRGDTTLVADPNGNTLIMLDANGKNVNVMTMPRPREASNIRNGTGSPGFDAKGRLIYRGTFPPIPTPPPAPGQPRVLPTSPDTFPLIAANFETRALDTLATVRASTGFSSSAVMTDNKLTMKMIRQPFPETDDWAVLSDGAIAIVRGHDYHIDWIYADGKRASTPKMPFDWRRLTLEDKQHVLDSLAELDARTQKMRDSMYAARGQTAPVSPTVQEWVPIKDIPDYYPPIRAGNNGVVGDRDRNLWILPTTSAQARGGLLYDVVNEKGEVFERVQLPGGCSLAGFGAKSRVYMACIGKAQGDSVSTTRLKRAAIIH